MPAQVKKWGNSASVRIPSAILDIVDLSIGQDVDIRAKDGCIVIAPIRKAVTLEHLLAQITPENLHREADFGEPSGKELL